MKIERIGLSRLVAHPGNPNRMSEGTFRKLLRNIERTGRYEPIVVRPCPQSAGYFEIINGHHRSRVLEKLGYKEANCVVWDVDDAETDILLSTLNRLGGRDDVAKKAEILGRLKERFAGREIAKMLPMTAGQAERLAQLAKKSEAVVESVKSLAKAMVFFVNEEQERVIEEALAKAETKGVNKAVRRAEALVRIARENLKIKEQS